MTHDAPPIYLHIGAPKTGTTYLQSVLHLNRAALLDVGMLYPGPRTNHFIEALDLLGQTFLEDESTADPGSWDRLTEGALSHPGPVLISHELLVRADPAIARRVTEGFGDRPVRLVITVRDTARQVPALWQEEVKNRGRRDLDTFVSTLTRQVQAGRNTAIRRMTDARLPLADWLDAVPPADVRVVVVPAPGAPKGLLWERFAAAIDVDATAFDPTGRRGNQSLGNASVELLRRLNVELRRGEDDFPPAVYRGTVKRFLAQQALAGRAEGAITLSRPQMRWCAELSEQMSAGLAASGHTIVGDLNDLIVPESAIEAAPDVVPGVAAADELAAAFDALVALVEREGRRHAARVVRDASGEADAPTRSGRMKHRWRRLTTRTARS